MLAVIILLIQLFTVKATGSVAYNTILFRELVNEKAPILGDLLLRSQYMKDPDNEIFKSYTIKLGEAVEQNKWDPSVDETNSSLEYGSVDELCTIMLNPLELISKLKVYGKKWKNFYNTHQGLLNYLDGILEMLAKSRVFSVVDGESSSGGKKRKFSFSLIRNLMLSDVSEFGDDIAKYFIKMADGVFKLINDAIVPFRPEEPETIIKKSDMIRLRLTYEDNTEKMLKLIRKWHVYLTFIFRDNIMLKKKLDYLDILAIFIQQISLSFFKYKYLIVSFKRGDSKSIDQDFKDYIENLSSGITWLVPFVIQPDRLRGFVEAIEPSHCEVIEQTGGKCTPNPAVNAGESNELAILTIIFAQLLGKSK